MQVPPTAAVAAIRGSHAALMTGLKTFTRRSRKLSTESPKALASMSSSTLSHSPGEAGEVGNNSKASHTVVDGQLNYRVRKRMQPALFSKAPEAETPCPNPPPSTANDLPGVASLVANGSPVVVAAAADTSVTESSSRRHSARVLKRVAEAEEQKLDVKMSLGVANLSVSRSRTVRRVSRKNAAAAAEPKVPQEAETCLSLPPEIATATTVDFWNSSLSGGSGSAVVVKDLVVKAAISPIMSGKTLFAVEELAKALEHLKSADPLLRTVIEMHDAPKFEKCESAFAALVRSIVFQQLATRAATVIFGRFITLCEGLGNLTPTTVSQLTVEQMRASGISGRKASYLHDLAANFLSGALSDSSINEMDDEALMAALIAVKGIGMWSVHMFMLFSLHKPDVLPVTDLGVRKGLQKLYKLKELPNPAQAEEIASNWQPYRSLGSWYMWRVMSNTPIVTGSD